MKMKKKNSLHFYKHTHSLLYKHTVVIIVFFAELFEVKC